MTQDESEVAASATAWRQICPLLSTSPEEDRKRETRANKCFLSEIHKEEGQKQEGGLGLGAGQ